VLKILYQDEGDGESEVPVVIDAMRDPQVVEVEGDRHVHGLEVQKAIKPISHFDLS
jgi:hypothetical protein